MPANVVSLKDYREHASARRHRDGTKLPQVYRVNGFYAGDMRGKTVLSDKKATPRYTLTTDNACGLSGVSYARISQLDPELDDGWLIVRHHPVPEESTEAYVDALNDMASDADDATGQAVYQTGEGVFTLIHRKPPPGAPNHLIIHITKAAEGFDVHRIIHPDGSVSEDYFGVTGLNAE